MLHAISWSAFGKTIFLLSLVYYAAIAVLCFRKEIAKFLPKNKPLILLLSLAIALPALGIAQTADGNNGINQANTLVRSYFQAGTQLMYAIGALVGLIGAVRVFRLWNSEQHGEAQRAAVAWFGSCIFLVIVATVIQSFFGI
jgi:Domain of unknown function (DUF4134)